MGHHILLAMPGPNIRFHTAQSAFCCCGRDHQLDVVGADNASWDNMNALWVTALNGVKDRGLTHFAMIHADICPSLDQDWINILIEEMESKDASYISAVVPIKDGRGVTSCGIGDPDGPWAPIRRFTMNELHAMPETFTAAEVGYGDFFLNHNSGLIMADLRDKRFFNTEPDGELSVWFNFRKRCYMDEQGVAKIQGESEDWNISRRIWQQGIPSCITRKVHLKHYGSTGFPNSYSWGMYEHDEDCPKWKENDLLKLTANVTVQKELPPGSHGGGGVAVTDDAPVFPFVSNSNVTVEE